MNENKIHIDLEGVPQTLLLPLLGRAKFSQESYSPIYDPCAVSLLHSLNYDFNQLADKVGNTTLFWIARAYHFDEAIKKYLKKHPTATIVNLGAGLDTTFSRVDNEKLTWVDIDLPEVIQLREKLLPPPNRVHYFAKSILDFSWIDTVKQFGDDVLFFAGGLFMYFTEEEVKSIFLKMANSFPHAELVFDTIAKKDLQHANAMLKTVKMDTAILKWGLDDSKELETWSPKIKVVSKIAYFKGLKIKFNFPLKLRLKMFFYDLFSKSSIIHIKFL